MVEEDCIQNYEDLEEIGRGGFAIVYKARLKGSTKDVAIKKISKKTVRERKLEKRVKDEIYIHERLHHENIVKLHTYFDDQKYHYLVMELCSKGSLEDYLKCKKQLNEAEARRFIKQIVEGLKYLHLTWKVMHRDISLKNILLSSDNTVKLADFGLSSKLSHKNEKKYSMLGTPNFMPPEAVVTNESHTLKRDCWSLGCVLYTLLVGKPPFDGKSSVDVISHVVMKDIYFPHYISKEAKELISSLLEKDQSKRVGIDDILDFDFFTKYENESLKSLRNEDSGTMSMGSSTMSSSRSSRRFNKTSDSGLDSINSRSGELKRNQEKAGKCLPTIQSSGGSYDYEPIRKVIGCPVYSNRERYKKSKFHGLVKNMPSLPSKNDLNNKPYHSSSLKDISVINDVAQYSDNLYERSASKERYQNNFLKKTSSSHHSSVKANGSCELSGCVSSGSMKKCKPSQTNASSYERSVSEERSRHRDRSSFNNHSIDNENKVGPGKTAHERSSRSKSNEKCTDRNCRFEKPFSMENNPKERLRNGSHDRAYRSENIECSPENSHPYQKKYCSDQGQPFKKKSTESATTNSLSQITEPLNTKRVQPMRKVTRHAVISISNEGIVYVEHLKEEKVVSFCEISPDGNRIIVYEPIVKPKLSNKPPSKKGCDLFPFYFETLPKEHFQFYKWAKTTVDIIRAKTPKVTIFGEKGKCVMMENGPNPDYEMEFYNDGGRITKTSSKTQKLQITSYIDQDGENHPLFPDKGIDKEYIHLWDYFLLMQEQCKLLEKQLEPLLKESDLPVFPIIVGKQPYRQPMDSHKENLKPLSHSYNSQKYYENEKSETRFPRNRALFKREGFH